MSNIQICRQHDLDKDECRAVAEDLLDQLVDRFGGSVSEQGDDYLFRHPAGVKAMVEARQGELNVNVKLGLMTRSLAPTLEDKINKVLDEQLG